MLFVRFAYSLVNDDEDIDDEEPEQGPNKNFGMFVTCVVKNPLDKKNQPATPYDRYRFMC
jgi:hypothetical protein